MTDGRIELRGLTYPRDDPIVRFDELDLKAGRRVVLFGPNGAGKTTLLRLIAGTLGDAEVPPSAYLPQTPYLFRGLAGWNLGLGLDAEAAGRARVLCEKLSVGHLLAEPAHHLSGGERQRLGLARVLAQPEPLVLLDEPLAALDLRDRMEVASVIHEALAGRTAVIVTHDREEAAVLGDRMIVLIDGEVAQDGDVADVFARPASADVAAIVGVGNVIEGTVHAVGEVLTEMQCGELSVSGIGAVEVGHAARAVFGGEAVTVYAKGIEPESSARNTWSGHLVEIRPADRLVELVIDVGAPVVALVTPGALDALAIEVGDRLTVAVKATAIQVLPA
jgi:molybdate transport system ATP-binding protein